jgi:hypothetical protein
MPLREEIFQEECTMFLLRWQDRILQDFANQDKNRRGSGASCPAGFFVGCIINVGVRRNPAPIFFDKKVEHKDKNR